MDLFEYQGKQFFAGFGIRPVGAPDWTPVGSVIRYDRANIMAVHAVADAWMPDWEMEGTQVVPLNGTRLDLRLENLTVSGDPRRGRPRSNKVWKRLRARQLFALCHDIEAVAEELGMTKKEVQLAVRQPDGSI